MRLDQEIRLAQRAGRLAPLSDGARNILIRLAKCCAGAMPCALKEPAWFGSEDSPHNSPDRVTDTEEGLSAVADGTAEDARELGALLAQLAELL